MAFFTNPNHYTYTTGGFGITLNALGTDTTGREYTQCFVVSGACLYVYIDEAAEGVQIFLERQADKADDVSDAIVANHYAFPFEILCYPTHFTSADKRFVYAAIPRNYSEVGSPKAVICYPSSRIDVFGRVVTKTKDDDGNDVESYTQVGNPDYYYIDLQGRISSSSSTAREWEHVIEQGAINGTIRGDEAAITRGSAQVTEEQLRLEIEDLRTLIEVSNFFERYSLDDTTETVQKTDEDGNLIYVDEEDNETTVAEGNTPVMISQTVSHTAVRLKTQYEGLFSEGWLSAFGMNGGVSQGSGGATGYNRLDSWDDYISGETDGWVLSAALGYDLHVNGSGNFISSITRDMVIEALGFTPVSEEDFDSSGWNAAVSSSHTHDNKSVLDGITSTLVSRWNKAYTNNHTHANKSVLDGISSTSMSLWGNEVPLGGSANGAITISNGDNSVTISVDDDGYLKIDGALYATSFISAFGLNGENAGGGADLSPSSWTVEPDFPSSYALPASLGWDLNSRVSAIEKNGFVSGVTSLGGASGDISLLNGQTSAGSVNLSIVDGQFQAALVPLSFSDISGTISFSDLPTMYWGNVKVSNKSNKQTAPTFKSVTIANSDNTQTATLTLDADGNLYLDKGFYSNSFVSAFGASGATEAIGVNIASQSWGDDSYAANNALPANLGYEKIEDILSRISALEGKATQVSYTGNYTTGTKLGEITIDGVKKTVYAPIPTKLSELINDADFITSKDNAASATKLQSARSLWGNSFNGTADVNGSLTFMDGSNGRKFSISYNGAIMMKAATTGSWASYFAGATNDGTVIGVIGGVYASTDTLTYTYYGGASRSDASMFILPSGNIGVGTSSPTEKLHVKGSLYATSRIYLYKNTTDSTKDVYLEYSSADKGVKLIGAGFWSDSYVSAFGANAEEEPDLSVSVVGSGNAVIDASYEDGTLTITKGNITSGVSSVAGLTGDITAANLKSKLGNPAWADITGKPFSSIGEGLKVESNVLKANVDLSGYLPLSGGTMTGNITMGKNKLIGTTTGTIDGVSSSVNAPLIYSGTVIFIGATKTASTHHLGSLYISSGYNCSKKTGYESVYVSVPNDTNDGATNYLVLHKGNYAATLNSVYLGINDTAKAATKLETSRTLWGNSFDGTANISGDITFAKGGGSRQLSIKTSGGINLNAGTSTWAASFSVSKNDGSKTLGSAYGVYGTADDLIYSFYGGTYSNPYMVILPYDGLSENSKSGFVGIGTKAPTEKLHVSGNLYATKRIYLYKNTTDSTKDVYLEYSSANNGVKLAGAGFWSDSYISAFGINDENNGISVSVTGSGNAVTDAYYEDGTLTITKGNITSGVSSVAGLSGDITTASLATQLGLGDLAYKSSLSYSDVGAAAASHGTHVTSSSCVTKFGGQTGAITVQGGLTDNGSVNLAMSGKQLQASIVGLGSSAFTDATAYTAAAHASNTSNPHSVTKAQVGLGNVENTKLSTWAGTSKITTLGTVTTGTWNGTAIANAYLANSSITIAGTSVSLGSSISASTIGMAMGKGKTAWGRTFWSSSGLPVTISGDLDNVGTLGFGGDAATSATPRIWYDAANKCIRTNVGFASESFISSFGVNTESVSDVIISGNLRLKNAGNYGTKLNFGDGDYAYVYEDTDDHLKIYADKGLWIGNTNSAIKIENSDSTTASSTGDKAATVTITSRLHIGDDWRGDQSYWKLYVDGRGYFNGNISVNGTVSVQGSVVHTSDMQLKNRYDDIDLSVKSIADSPCFEFDYKSDILASRYIGSSAQYWRDVLPTTVKEDESGWLSLDYNAVTFASVVALARRSESHEERIARLEAENEELRNKIVELENNLPS